MKSRSMALAGFAALTMSVGGVAAVSAQATTAEFTFTKAPVTITGVAAKTGGTQKFTSTATSGTVECTTAATSGTITAVKNPKQKVAVKYSKCTAFTFEGPTISEAEYEFTPGTLAASGTESTGTAAILNTITIKVPLAGCEVTVGPTGNSALSSVVFKSDSGKILEETKVTGITDTVSGSGASLCGGSGTHTNGTYTGNNEVSSTEAELGIA